MTSMFNAELTSKHDTDSAWDRALAQLVIAGYDSALKESLESTKQDVDDHNICLARVSFVEAHQEDLILAAYSASSILGTKRCTDFGFEGCITKDVDNVKLEYACQGRKRHHTEPKLVNAITQDPSIWVYAVGGRTIRNVTIVSQIDVCGTCRPHTMTKFKVALEQRGASLTVYELQKNPGQGRESQYTLNELKI